MRDHSNKMHIKSVLTLANQIDTPKEIQNAFNVFVNKRNIKPTKKRF